MELAKQINYWPKLSYSLGINKLFYVLNIIIKNLKLDLDYKYALSMMTEAIA
jgi:hypothetical protein